MIQEIKYYMMEIKHSMIEKNKQVIMMKKY